MATPVISIRDLSFSFQGADKRALRNVSLDVYAGELVLIAGPSGCGKSTLAKAMSGHIPHVIEGEIAGRVLIDGVDARQLDLSDIGARVSLCLQDPQAQFCTLAVRDEVAFGPENLTLPVDEVARRVDDSLAAVDASHLKDRDIFHLSGGEQQRVAIASTLAMAPEVIILDEPTSSLGPDSASEVWEAIAKLRAERGTTIIVIEHRFEPLLSLATRMIVMESGEILLDGDPASTANRYLEDSQPDWPAASLAINKQPQAAARLAIHASDVRFNYGGKEILQGVSLDVAPGEFIGVIGVNGSGKTTFLSCLAGLERASAGAVEVEGVDMMRARVSDIARKIGFVFQSPDHQIFESTVEEETLFAAKNFKLDRADAARRLLREYGLIAYRERHPLKLSHGEKRRLNLCSVLPHGPATILLDEPFIGQDAANSARILGDLMRLRAAGATIVMVSHDMEIVYGYCDRVVLFDAGRILVDAAPAEAAQAIAALGRTAFLPPARRA